MEVCLKSMAYTSIIYLYHNPWKPGDTQRNLVCGLLDTHEAHDDNIAIWHESQKIMLLSFIRNSAGTNAYIVILLPCPGLIPLPLFQHL